MAILDDQIQQADIETALLRPLTPTEVSYVPALRIQALSLLRARMQDIDARVEEFTAGRPQGVDPRVVVTVLARVIARFMRNPDGATSISQGVGPYTNSRGYSGSTKGPSPSALGAMQITDADVAAILPPTFSPGRTIKTRPHRHGWPL